MEGTREVTKLILRLLRITPLEKSITYSAPRFRGSQDLSGGADRKATAQGAQCDQYASVTIVRNTFVIVNGLVATN